jgi:hypothetical protein
MSATESELPPAYLTIILHDGTLTTEQRELSHVPTMPTTSWSRLLPPAACQHAWHEPVLAARGKSVIGGRMGIVEGEPDHAA